jgi:hypothetical protein
VKERESLWFTRSLAQRTPSLGVPTNDL